MTAEITKVGQLERVAVSRSERCIDLSAFAEGIHAFDELIFSLRADGQVDWVVSAVCDHAHGRLKLCDGNRIARCPLHGWELDTQSLAYRNVGLKKPQIPFEQAGQELKCQVGAYKLALPENLQSDARLRAEVRFISHACVSIDVAGLRIVTDPWLFGPCFVAGWWHAAPPKADALDLVNSADVIYVSHNHPDHMHIETLAEVRRDVRIVVPDFPSLSTIKPIREMGFTNADALPFNTVFQVGDGPVHFSILQAGDFRDDSGLYLSAGDFSCLLAVDSNALNNFVLPQEVDLLMTAFAGGASGFPLCFDVVPDEQKDRVVTRNRSSASSQAMEYIRRVKPKCFVPYAGYFTEAAGRDVAVKTRNKKNSSADVIALAETEFAALVTCNPLDTDLMVFENGDIAFSNVDLPRLYDVDEAYTGRYIDVLKEELAGYSAAAIADYFEQADFRDDLVLYLVPTDDDFNVDEQETATMVDFRGRRPNVRQARSSETLLTYDAADENDGRHLLVRVRKDSLWRVIRNRFPWEDLSIGFQCRIDRKPDVYNSDFWFHFTNVHIGKALEPA